MAISNHYSEVYFGGHTWTVTDAATWGLVFNGELNDDVKLKPGSFVDVVVNGLTAGSLRLDVIVRGEFLSTGAYRLITSFEFTAIGPTTVGDISLNGACLIRAGTPPVVPVPDVSIPAAFEVVDQGAKVLANGQKIKFSQSFTIAASYFA